MADIALLRERRCALNIPSSDDSESENLVVMMTVADACYDAAQSHGSLTFALDDAARHFLTHCWDDFCKAYGAFTFDAGKHGLTIFWGEHEQEDNKRLADLEFNIAKYEKKFGCIDC